MKQKIIVPREVLLVEIERYCTAPECNARTRIGLTKEEARAYCGFECERCKLWNDDLLTERDVPEWWEELMITDLSAIREAQTVVSDEPNATITRLSEAFKSEEEQR
jgi:hypothetical protein